MKEKSRLYKKWWFWLCVVLAVCVITIATVTTVLNTKDPKNFSAKEIVKYLEKKGYEFDAYKIENTKDNNFAYYVEIEKNNIELLWTNWNNNSSYYWRDTNLSNMWADISDKNNNSEAERKEQKQAFAKWCDEIKLTRKQICNALDYYYKNTDDFRIKENKI